MNAFTIDDAIALAAVAHRHQRDRGRPDLPYITHPMRVMSAFDDPVLQMIAVLHDAVEDTALTLEQMRMAGAPKRVLAGVDAVTHRKGESDYDYWARVRANPDALAVKLVDIDDNTDPRRVELLPAEVADRLSDKYARARAALLGTPAIQDAMQRVADMTGGTLRVFDSQRADERVDVLEDTVDEGGSGTGRITISLDSGGTFRWRGHDTGERVSRVFGPSITSYEWVYSVPPSRVYRLVAALDGRPDEDVLQLVRRRRKDGISVEAVLRSEAINANFETWHS